MPGFHLEMEAQRKRSKDSREGVDLTAVASLVGLAAELGTPTSFVGYESLSCGATVKAIMFEGRQVQDAEAGGDSQTSVMCLSYF